MHITIHTYIIYFYYMYNYYVHVYHVKLCIYTSIIHNVCTDVSMNARMYNAYYRDFDKATGQVFKMLFYDIVDN